MTNKENTGLIIMGLGALYLWYTYEPKQTGINPIFSATSTETEYSGPSAQIEIQSAPSGPIEINTNNLLTAADKAALFSDNQDINIIDAETPPKPSDFGLQL